MSQSIWLVAIPLLCTLLSIFNLLLLRLLTRRFHRIGLNNNNRWTWGDYVHMVLLIEQSLVVLARIGWRGWVEREKCAVVNAALMLIPVVYALGFYIFFSKSSAATTSARLLPLYTVYATCGAAQLYFWARGDLLTINVDWILAILETAGWSLLILLVGSRPLSGGAGESQGPCAHYEKQASPEATMSFFSSMLFSWMNGLISLGSHRPLEKEDLWELASWVHPEEVYEEFQGKRSNTLLRRIWLLNRGILWRQLGLALAAVALSYAPPYFLQQLLLFFEHPSQGPLVDAYLAAFCIFLTSSAYTVVDNQEENYNRLLMLRTYASLQSEVYRKFLRRKLLTQNPVTGESEAEVSDRDETGRLLNLMTTDAERVSSLFNYLIALSMTPLHIVLGTLFLYNVLGWSALIGMLALLLALPLQLVSSRAYSRLQKSLLQTKDARISLTSELLKAVRIVKFCAFERRFGDKILEAREKELKCYLHLFIIRGIFDLTWFLLPTLVTIIALFSYTKIFQNELTAAKTFTAITLFDILRVPFTLFTEKFLKSQDAIVSLRRLEVFLQSEESEKYDPQQDVQGQIEEGGLVEEGDARELALVNGTFCWPTLKSSSSSSISTKISSEDHCSGITHGLLSQVLPTSSTSLKPPVALRALTISFPRGKLSIICGPTGCGKTALLLALLGEMERVGGFVQAPTLGSQEEIERARVVDSSGLSHNGVAYVAQQAWLLNATVRDNILFGEEWNAERYRRVIEACALTRDLEILRAGDLTEIGENGITLSGGQKQRIALARALYSPARHLLLDDPLSAVDANVARHIYEQCLTGDLTKGRTRILVTHHLKLSLPSASMILLMGEGGTVVGRGTVDEIKEQGLLSEVLSVEGKKQVESMLAMKEEEEEGEEGAETISDPSSPSPAMGDDEDGQSKPIFLGTNEEMRQRGRTQWSVYGRYLKANGNVPFWILLMTLFSAHQLLEVVDRWVLKVWSEDTSIPGLWSWTLTTLAPGTLIALSAQHDNNYYLRMNPSVPCSWTDDWKTLAIVVILIFRTAALYYGSLRASRNLHQELLRVILHAPLRFFDTCPIGRVLNRFSNDLDTIDNTLALNWSFVLWNSLQIIAGIAVISVIAPAFLLFVVGVGILYSGIGLYYIRSSRELKRLSSVARSPVYSLISETSTGLATIRAFGREAYFFRDLLKRINRTIQTTYFLWACNRWLAVRVELLGSSITFIVAILLLGNLDHITAGGAGLALTFTRTVLLYSYWLILQLTYVELELNSVERVEEYIRLIPQEPPAIIENSRPPAGWPFEGKIVVQNLWIRYSPELDPVLRNLSFEIKGGEKIAIVGRTGSGKSTLALALMRFMDPCEGRIEIDGVDITSIGVEDLRSRLTIIPQDAILMSGTVRSNLDQFDEYDDSALWDALYSVHLVPRTVSSSSCSSLSSSAGSSLVGTNSHGPAPNHETAPQVTAITSLDDPVAEGGSNFSQGQRQLLCLARALLHRSKIVIMDEATSSVDMRTDRKIQRTLRALDLFVSGSTLITIAHRLHTVIDYDRVMVLDAGEVVEFDEPRHLFHRETSMFRQLCVQSGELDHLRGLLKT
ncbi:uncharacterized protein VTP21DRAFT_178 [Calcarisporiella thermophila]|uniref:uncharacterized protein n=1 Tax=Calcarisporiella thermophila TaxID=911321 RepID=UPI00374325AE